MALIMRVIPQDMYDQLINSVKAQSGDTVEPMEEDPPQCKDVPADLLTDPGLNPPSAAKEIPKSESLKEEAGVPGEIPHKSDVQTFPEWNEFSDKSTQAEPEILRPPLRRSNRRIHRGGRNKRRRQR